MSRWLGWIPRALGSPINTLLGLGLFVFLVALPLAGIHVSDHAELIGGNFTNVAGYLGASIAAGASVVNLHEGRKHRTRVTDHHDRVERALKTHTARLDTIRQHIVTAPRGDTERTAP